jgi:hypothetical protein
MVRQTGMVRMAHKQMADERAMEEQMERENPMMGSGATPSMGLSQIRGGRKQKCASCGCVKCKCSDSSSDDEDAMAQGSALSEHLHKLHGRGYARSFHKGMGGGLGTGRYEGEGMCGSASAGASFSKDQQDFSGHMKGGFWGLAALALPLVSKLLGNGHMTQEGHSRLMDMLHHHEKMRGGFDWGKLIQHAVPLVSHLLGQGHMSEEAQKKFMAFLKTKGKKMEGAGRAVGGASAGMKLNMTMKDRVMPSPRNPPKMELQMEKMEGKGILSNLGIPVVSDIAGMFGLGKKKRAVSAGDGRRKRAEIVKRVMAEKGMKMIEASKYVKEHNLY